jgi:hypothetical protein
MEKSITVACQLALSQAAVTLSSLCIPVRAAMEAYVRGEETSNFSPYTIVSQDMRAA